MIGPVLGENDRWCRGVLAKNDYIYYPPSSERQRNMLKINKIAGTVETIDLHLQPQLTEDED
jgi:hypothetical protein